VRRRPLLLRPHLPEVSIERPRRPDLAIGIAPFRDLRSELSLDPQRPSLSVAWLGVVRSGENSTGRRSFLRNVADGAREDAARTLEYAQLFREVRLVEDEAVPEDLDLVLVGEIEELVGFQFQRTSLGLFAVAGYRSRVDPPIGTARIRFRLLGREGEVLRERIETRVQTEGLSMEQVAIDALAAASERLAVELFRRFVQPSEPSPRKVPIRVLDACGLGGRRAGRLIEDASEIFEREIGVRFRPRVETWLAPEEGGAEALLEAAERLRPPAGGIVLALAPRDRRPELALGAANRGLARWLGRHAVVVCESIEPNAVTVAHELAHLFGAVHSKDRGSVMYPVALFDARFFDAVNRRVLRASRGRPFDGKLPEPLIRKLRRIYAEAGDAAEIDASVARDALDTLP